MGSEIAGFSGHDARRQAAIGVGLDPAECDFSADDPLDFAFDAFGQGLLVGAGAVLVRDLYVPEPNGDFDFDGAAIHHLCHTGDDVGGGRRRCGQ